MADQGWTARVATAAAVAAATGAAQLGVGYGLGIVVWPSSATAGDSTWLSSLGWATWIAANSVVFGAVTASRPNRDTASRPTNGRPNNDKGSSGAGRPGALAQSGTTGPWRSALAAAAAVGALLTVALLAVPARWAGPVDAVPTPGIAAPHVIAAGYAVVGILVGIVVAFWAMASRPAAANLVATAVWLWLVATAFVVHALVTGHRLVGINLGGGQLTGPGDGFRFGTVYWPGALLTLVAAVVIGALAARPSVRRGDHGAGAASSGAAGPLLVAAAYFALIPQLTGTPGDLESAHLIAPYAVLAGLAGSALTVAAGKRSAANGRRSAVGGKRSADHTRVRRFGVPWARGAETTATADSATTPKRAQLPKARPAPGTADGDADGADDGNGFKNRFARLGRRSGSDS